MHDCDNKIFLQTSGETQEGKLIIKICNCSDEAMGDRNKALKTVCNEHQPIFLVRLYRKQGRRHNLKTLHEVEYRACKTVL